MTAPNSRDDSGLSLIELLVYCMLLGVILAVTGGILISSLSAQQQVTGLTETADVGQLISRSVEEGVRNASGPLGATDPDQIIGIRAEPMTSDGQLLRARVAVGATGGVVTWECQAWFYSPETESFYWARDASGAISNPGGFSVDAGQHVADDGDDAWILVGSGVELPTGSSTFFGTAESQVTLRFTVKAEDVSLVLIPNTVVSRKPVVGGTGPTACF